MLRILDANSNRAREALRVCEEITRFVLNHRSFSLQLKKVRHEVTRVIQQLPLSYKDLLKMRESKDDVGNDMALYPKGNVGKRDLLISNMKRAQEAVRVLEEFSKVVSKKASKKFQRIRFQLYQLEKKIILKL